MNDIETEMYPKFTEANIVNFLLWYFNEGGQNGNRATIHMLKKAVKALEHGRLVELGVEYAESQLRQHILQRKIVKLKPVKSLLDSLEKVNNESGRGGSKHISFSLPS